MYPNAFALFSLSSYESEQSWCRRTAFPGRMIQRWKQLSNRWLFGDETWTCQKRGLRSQREWRTKASMLWPVTSFQQNYCISACGIHNNSDPMFQEARLFHNWQICAPIEKLHWASMCHSACLNPLTHQRKWKEDSFVCNWKFGKGSCGVFSWKGSQWSGSIRRLVRSTESIDPDSNPPNAFLLVQVRELQVSDSRSWKEISGLFSIFFPPLHFLGLMLWKIFSSLRTDRTWCQQSNTRLVLLWCQQIGPSSLDQWMTQYRPVFRYRKETRITSERVQTLRGIDYGLKMQTWACPKWPPGPIWRDKLHKVKAAHSSENTVTATGKTFPLSWHEWHTHVFLECHNTPWYWATHQLS